MNEQNLRPIKSSHEEATRNGRKGGIKSAEVRRKKKELREAWLLLLSTDFGGQTVLERLNGGLAKRVIETGDPNAYEKIMEYAGLSVKQELKEDELKLKHEELKLRIADATRKNPPIDAEPTVFEQMVKELYERSDGEAEEVHD